MQSILLLALLALAACSPRYSPATSTPLGLGPLAGKWSGTLTYTDYRDDSSRATLPITATVRAVEDPAFGVSGMLFEVSYTEPNGSSGGSSQTLMTPLPDRPRQFGYDLEAWTLIESQSDGDGFTITIEQPGEDNDRPATIRHTLRYRDGAVQDRMMVRYDGTDDFFERNIIEMERR